MMLETMLIILVVLTAVAIKLKNLIHSVIVLAGADIVLALIFYLLSAPDVALAQVSVCAGLTTMVFLVVLGKTQRREE